MPPAFEDLKNRAAAFLADIPGPNPAGAPATLEIAYESVRGEIEKLASPSGVTVDWKGVSEKSGELLRTKSKDLFLASVMAHALHVTGGAEGLTTGAVILAELMDRYWDTMQPDAARLRARVNALTWFVERTQLLLANARAAPLEQAEAMEVGLRRLAEVTRSRMADKGPSFSKILQVAERWKQEAAPPPPPPQPAAAPAPGSAAPAAAPAGPPLPGGLASAGEAVEYLRGVGAALVSAASTLRGADASDPTAYRLLRAGVWLHILGPPPSTGGRTQIPPLPEPLRGQLALLVQNQRWSVLVEECESAIPANRFALDLQRLCGQGLEGLGASHERARDAVAAELRSLLVRLPQLPTLAFADGTPLADPQTQAWLESISAGPKGGGGPSKGTEESEAAVALAEAQRAFAANRGPEALARMHEVAASGRTGRERFLLRLEVGRVCAATGLAGIAKALFADLAREAEEHGIDDWEPSLAAESLKGLIAAVRALAKDPRGADAGIAQHYERLCRLDPAAALTLWP